jgi:hypothetical protein
MNSGLCYVAAGLFMIAAAVFAGNVRTARGDEAILPMIGILFSGLMVCVVASIREHKKDRA